MLLLWLMLSPYALKDALSTGKRGGRRVDRTLSMPEAAQSAQCPSLAVFPAENIPLLTSVFGLSRIFLHCILLWRRAPVQDWAATCRCCYPILGFSLQLKAKAYYSYSRIQPGVSKYTVHLVCRHALG